MAKTREEWSYSKLKNLFDDKSYPLMVVDLNIFDRNLQQLNQVASSHDKNLRPASKSVRVPFLLKRIMEKGDENVQGLLCFSPSEANFLSQLGFNDLVVAYPRVQQSTLRDFDEAHCDGTTITMMVDDETQVERLEKLHEHSDSTNSYRVAVDVDMSYRPVDFLHLGVRRSPVLTLEDFRHIYKRIKQSPVVRFVGVMGYEAQVAGLPDQNPHTTLKNPLIKFVKNRSKQVIAEKRRQIRDFLADEGEELDFFNGGGTGSIYSTVEEDAVTEVTAGSGFLQSQLFDYFECNKNTGAFCFGLPVTRQPTDNIVTCQSGGFIASGPVNEDKQPEPFLPKDVEPLDDEGFGEVQTPLRVPDHVDLEPGDPVFFRPAKAGEIAEQFNVYHLMEDDEVVERVETYRGMGKRFF